MNRARAKNPFRALVDLAVKEAGAAPLLSRTIGAGSVDQSPAPPVAATAQNADGELTWTALTGVDRTQDTRALTEAGE